MIGLRRLWRRPACPDPEAFLDDLRRAAFGPSYDSFDRYRDFRAVFESEAGRRVLAQIMEWCLMWRSTAAPEPHDTYYNEGKRAIGLQIMKVMGADSGRDSAPVPHQRREGDRA